MSPGERSRYGKLDVDIAAGCVRVRANLVGLGYQRFGLLPAQFRDRHL